MIFLRNFNKTKILLTFHSFFLLNMILFCVAWPPAGCVGGALGGPLGPRLGAAPRPLRPAAAVVARSAARCAPGPLRGPLAPLRSVAVWVPRSAARGRSAPKLADQARPTAGRPSPARRAALKVGQVQVPFCIDCKIIISRTKPASQWEGLPAWHYAIDSAVVKARCA